MKNKMSLITEDKAPLSIHERTAGQLDTIYDAFATLKKDVHCIGDDSGATFSLCVSRDDRYIFRGSSDCLSVWCTKTGRCVRTFEIKGLLMFYRMTLTPDETGVVSVSYSGEVYLSDLKTGHSRALFNCDLSSPRYFDFDAAGKHLVIAGNIAIGSSRTAMLHILEFQSGNIVREIRIDNRELCSCAMDPDQTLLAAGMGDGTIRLIGVDDGSLLHRIQTADTKIWHVAVSSDGRQIAATGDVGSPTVHLWHTASAVKIDSLSESTDLNNILFYPATDDLIVTRNDGIMVTWNADRQTVYRTEKIHDNVFKVAHSQSGRIIYSVGGQGFRLCRHNLETKSIEVVADRISTNNFIMRWYPSKRQVLYSDFKSVFSLDLNTGERTSLLTRTLHPSYWSFSLSSNNLSFPEDECNVLLWNTEQNNLQNRFEGHKKPVSAVASSSDEKWFASGDESGGIRLWELPCGRCIRQWVVSGSVASLQFTPDSRFLLSAAEGRVLAWNLESGRCLRELAYYNEQVRIAGISSDGHYGVVITWQYNRESGFTEILDLRAGVSIRRVNGCAAKVLDNQLFLLRNNLIHTIDLASGQTVCETELKLPVLSCDYEFDIDKEDSLILVSQKNMLHFMNLTDGALLASYCSLLKTGDCLWTTPPDEYAPNGWLWTNRPDLIHLSREDMQTQERISAAPDSELFQNYLNRFNSRDMVMLRINNYSEYERRLKILLGQKQASIVESRREMLLLGFESQEGQP